MLLQGMFVDGTRARGDKQTSLPVEGSSNNFSGELVSLFKINYQKSTGSKKLLYCLMVKHTLNKLHGSRRLLYVSRTCEVTGESASPTIRHIIQKIVIVVSL